LPAKLYSVLTGPFAGKPCSYKGSRPVSPSAWWPVSLGVTTFVSVYGPPSSGFAETPRIYFLMFSSYRRM